MNRQKGIRVNQIQPSQWQRHSSVYIVRDLAAGLDASLPLSPSSISTKGYGSAILKYHPDNLQNKSYSHPYHDIELGDKLPEVQKAW
ncbi:hypothetical protein OWV82_019449 [Melia azedarach]|uniref:Uncharacterized protein n=1 Tax=Melia azedarach TaxID=155640 RepID=A0ACC1XH48_MELAZ|nr:hypothetical protein OWV82_019449 [Melia azedarach]